jgi:hypothetical protein
MPETELPSQRTRRKELDRIERLGAQPMPPKFSGKVVGVSFTPHYPHNLRALCDVYDEAAASVGWQDLGLEAIPVILIRDTANTYDVNAVQVHVPSLGQWAMIGHLASPIAARLAPELDAGGVSITLERVTP